jgi:hypothetical protein
VPPGNTKAPALRSSSRCGRRIISISMPRVPSRSTSMLAAARMALERATGEVGSGRVVDMMDCAGSLFGFLF